MTDAHFPNPWRESRNELKARIRELEQAIEAALDELGVPGPGYPAPVANAIAHLSAVKVERVP